MNTGLSETLIERAGAVLASARQVGVTLATVESCTGGLVSALLTAVPGSSDVFVGGLVTYSNAAKSALAGVAPALIMAHGAVSAEVAHAMATGGLRATGAGVCVAITGVAGPGGGSAAKPVGLVHFCVARSDAASIAREERFGPLSRDAIRGLSAGVALNLLEALCVQAT
jgi:nicotinamide-nucleotide amidase